MTKAIDKKKAIEMYNEESVTTLDIIDAIRMRCGMYIGSNGIKGVHHIILEGISNSIDEFLNNFCDSIRTIIHEDGSISVIDDARGMPVGKIEDIATKAHTGAKFGQEGTGYNTSGGMHGTGLKAINACSEWLIVEVKREGKVHQLKFKRGKVDGELKVVGSCPKDETGTTIRFLPDTQIFTDVDVQYPSVREQVQQLSFLSKGLLMTLVDMRDGQEKDEEFLSKEGLVDFIRHMNDKKAVINKKIFYCDNKTEDGSVEVAMQYNDSYVENVKLFTNNIPNSSGTQLTGYRTAVTRTLNEYAKNKKLFKKGDENLTGEDLKEGLTLVISLKLSDPIFDGQTKESLNDARGRKIVEQIVAKELKLYLENNPKEAKAIIQKGLNAQKGRKAAKRARETQRRKTALGKSTVLPGKLADCQSNNADECELFLVEGDSAGGSAKQGRDRKVQAILPLRGKILNVEKKTLDKILGNNEIKSMITGIGGGVGKEFDVSKIRYDKVIIMTDADVDGAHIRTLLLTFFYRYMKQLVVDGHVYAAMPPLYKVSKGKKHVYVYTDKELNALLDKVGRDTVEIQRYKGLGEMDAEQLFDTTMNPDDRKLIQLTVEDAEEADAVFDILMGDAVPPRKQFIMENGHLATIDM